MAGADGVRALAAVAADEAELDLVEVAVRGAPGGQLVRVVVDRKGGVDLATCQALSRTLSDRFDAVDAVPGRYTLEVTSPGTDRPLRDRRAFERVEGRDVLVHRRLDDGRVVQVRGRVLAATPTAVLLDVDGTQTEIGYEQVAKATQTLPW